MLKELSKELRDRLYLVHISEKSLPKDYGLRIAREGVENSLLVDVSPHAFGEAIGILKSRNCPCSSVVTFLFDYYVYILQLVDKIDLFRGLRLGQAGEVLQVARREAHPSGAVIIKEGTPGEAFYVLASGTSFHHAIIIAIVFIFIKAIDKHHQYHHIINHHQSPSITTNHIINHQSLIIIINQLTLIVIINHQYYHSNIFTGVVTVTGQGWVRNLIAGDYFGEMALVSGDPRTATVTAKTDVQLIKFSKHDFLTLIRGNPETLRYTNKKKKTTAKKSSLSDLRFFMLYIW